MALPKGWDETKGEWRVRIRAPGRFTRIRTKTLEGVNGVAIVGGPLKPSDREASRHEPGAFVPQALRFKKDAWPSLTAAVGWFQASRFSGVREENPPKGSLPQIETAYNDGYNNGRIDRGTGNRSEYSYAWESNYSLEHSDSGIRWRTAYTMGYRDGWDGRPRRRDFTTGDSNAHRNPPKRSRRPRRLEDFAKGVDVAVRELVETEAEISSVFAQAVEITDRGGQIPEWIRDRMRGLELERKAKLEAVRTAVARRASALQEFEPSWPRRENPARARATAIRMYEEFHGGRPPTRYRLQRVPDLSQLVTLGHAVSIDYQLEPHVARGRRNTPYRHAFAPGSTLLTDPTGRALVIVGNIKVSRSPRGRYGYIREARV